MYLDKFWRHKVVVTVGVAAVEATVFTFYYSRIIHLVSFEAIFLNSWNC